MQGLERLCIVRTGFGDRVGVAFLCRRELLIETGDLVLQPELVEDELPGGGTSDLLRFHLADLFEIGSPGNQRCDRNGDQHVGQPGADPPYSDHDDEGEHCDAQRGPMGAMGRGHQGIPDGFVVVLRLFDADPEDLAEL